MRKEGMKERREAEGGEREAKGRGESWRERGSAQGMLREREEEKAEKRGAEGRRLLEGGGRWGDGEEGGRDPEAS